MFFVAGIIYYAMVCTKVAIVSKYLSVLTDAIGAFLPDRSFIRKIYG